jgi:hypothetical protein
MKTFAAITLLLFSVCTALSQELKYQTFKAQLKLSAFKNGENFQWTNNNISVTLNYKTGDFLLKLRNNDFKEKSEDGVSVNEETESTIDTEYLF